MSFNLSDKSEVINDNHWEELKLGEVCELITRGITPSYTENNGVPVINQKCIRDNRVNLELARFTNPEKKKIPEQKYLKEYDVLVNSTGVGTLGRVAQIKNIKNKLTVDSHVTIVRANKKVHSEFLGYNLFMQQPNIEHLAEGSTGQTELSRTRLGEAIKILMPSFEEQKAIANIFSNIDKKIDINNTINKKLEEMAQAIFKQWFVDYEFPNEDGEPYKSSGGEMVESEIGMLPKGWQYINLEDVVESANTGADAIRRAPIVEYDTGIKCVRVGDLSNGRDISGWGYCKVSDEDYDKFALKKNDILITRTATIGLNMFVYEDIKAVFNNGLIRIKVNDEYNPLFIYQVLNYKDYYDHISKITGETSTRPNMKINYLLNYKFILPSKTIRNRFENTINPIVYKINQNNEENKILAITRDSLLPKLMSGEIRVPVESN